MVVKKTTTIYLSYKTLRTKTNGNEKKIVFIIERRQNALTT